MPPVVLFVATKVPIAVSMSAAAAAPIPSAAVRVAVPGVTRLDVSAAVLSVIALLKL